MCLFRYGSFVSFMNIIFKSRGCHAVGAFGSRGQRPSTDKYSLDLQTGAQLRFISSKLQGSVQQELKGDQSFPVQPNDVVELLESSEEYMENLRIAKELKELCKVEHKMCAAWALNGECERNPQWDDG
ncbi:unnamed protein product [Cylindrotheca closterium]|uniref:Uncharacterized protein n=1 Tax=Cylindrotheca closterium TaxID=2856 RepID=A0AAD2CE81_9STRA|nr:unnamed protein product [Cylindrotheca closterium]